MGDRSASEIVEGLLVRVVQALGLEGEVTVVEADDELRATVAGEGLGLLIGRHGQTIEAVQHLAVRAVVAQTGEHLRVVVDAEGYRARRQEALEAQAAQAASEAVRSDRAVALAAMSASERRLVHEFLRDRTDVETHSEGEEPDRRLVVAPAAR